MSEPVETLLSRLERVRRVGPDRWIARCPTREDKSPSLSIRLLDDGRVLLHDFGGDDVESVLRAVGLSLADLYPSKAGLVAKPISRPVSASDVLALVAFESMVAVVVCGDVLRKKAVTEIDFARLKTAAQRLGDAAEYCRAR